MYSWGQIRFLLQTAYPGVSVDLLDEYINVRYARILDFYAWKGLEASGILETIAPVTTGTVAVTQGQFTVLGTGTAWGAQIDGMRIRIAGDTPFYTVSYQNSSFVNLDRRYEGGTASGSGYTIFQHKYPLPVDAKEVLSIFSNIWGADLDQLTTSYSLDDAAGQRTEMGSPSIFAVCEDTADSGLGDALHQVELYPIPDAAIGYPLRYIKTGAGLNGDNTGDAPLPFVSIPCLMNGCKSDLSRYLKDYKAASDYEALFTVALNEMVRIDTQRQGYQPLQMADMWTRHRVNRVLRGFTRRILN